MSIFDDMTIKAKGSRFWIFSPIVAIIIAIILWVNFQSNSSFSWSLLLLVVSILVIFLIVWKIISYIRSNDKEVRDYEKELKKSGRR